MKNIFNKLLHNSNKASKFASQFRGIVVTKDWSGSSAG